MNISAPQYSVSTRGLRQKDVISDQKHELIFTYPVLYEESLGKHVDLIRNFIAVSMLKEIFVNNAINIVKIASQVAPLTDERGNVHNTIDLINQSRHNMEYNISAREDPLAVAKSELSDQVKKKTAIIRELLASDPKLKQLSPYVEMITMNNLIDVPVIVGTLARPISSRLLAFVLYSSIVLKKPLDSKANVDAVFNNIRQTTDGDLSIIINNAVQSVAPGFIDTAYNKTKDKAHWLYGHAAYIKDRVLHSKRRAEILKRRRDVAESARKESVNVVRDNKLEAKRNALAVKLGASGAGRRTDYKDYHEIFNLLSGLKNNLGYYKSNVELMVDKAKLMNTLNYKGFKGHDEGAASKVIRKYENDMEAIKKKSLHRFNGMSNSFLGSLITSSFNLFKNTANRNLDINKIVQSRLFDGKDSVKDVAETAIEKFFDNLSLNVIPKINDDKLIKYLNVINTSIYKGLTDVVHDIAETLSKNRVPALYGDESSEVYKFIETVGNDFVSLNKDHEEYIHLLDKMFPELHLSIIKKEYEIGFTNQFERFIEEISELKGNFVIGVGDDREQIAIFKNRIIPEYNKAGTETLINFINSFTNYYKVISGLFLICSIIEGLAAYVDVIKIDLNTADKDVLDDLNYSVVMSIETSTVLATLVNAQNFRTLMNDIRNNRNKKKNPDEVIDQPDLQSGNSPSKVMININDNYVKGIVKYLTIGLKFPNIFVVDEGGNKVYFKLMYMKDVNNISLSGMQTYINSTTKTTLTDSSSSLYF